MINVVLVDDHKVFLQGVESLLSSDPELNVLKKFTDGTDFFRYMKEGEHPDVLLLDIEMKGISGVEVAENVIQLYPEVHVIMLSTYFSEEFVDKLVNTGISGYLLKSTDFEDLIKAIKNVANGKFSCSPEIMDILVKGYKSAGSADKGDSEEDDGPLTERELEMLQLIADEYTTKEIAEKIYISEHTVKTHRKNLMQKLDVKNTAGLVKKGYILGLIE
ncbi:response regulator [Gracilimonas mengyeensis]|uniref:Two component transcriptional regulator, LuxR family n=1 Tax=Gracilimonas mengyeensis TaxID=1302730 RepID=A0A521EEB9_9BACT|nr:response regulator transcription factor [Gracilimonas mengyeensis]SMO82248.1 two component transcriptional regulator, LuxR family [Gracilimonas mengyeensis]